MTYIAKHYVKIAGRVYTPGELIPGDAVAKLNGERPEWLVGIRAIIACAPVPMPAPAVPEAEDETAEAAEPEQQDAAEDAMPEIDAADGLVMPADEDKPEPRKGGRKRK